jgi:hypothetical protein
MESAFVVIIESAFVVHKADLAKNELIKNQHAGAGTVNPRKPTTGGFAKLPERMAKEKAPEGRMPGLSQIILDRFIERG